MASNEITDDDIERALSLIKENPSLMREIAALATVCVFDAAALSRAMAELAIALAIERKEGEHGE